MPQLGLGTEIGRVSGGAYDSDALAYFSRAGIASGTQTPSSYDNAASFNGTNQFLSTPLTGVNTSQPWSFSCWANVSSSTGYILGKGTDSNGNFGPCISALGFRMSTDGTWGANIREISFGSSFSLNRWTHLAMTWNATDGMRGYVNGVQVGAVAAPTCFNSASEFTIGRYTSFVTAAISSVGAWSKALTASEVSQLWNNGAGRTYASLDSGLRNNLISWWALNGTSSAVSLTDSAPTGNNLTNNGTVTAPNIGPIVTTTQNSRQLINNFVKGIKSLGLWNSMVCWPLRSSQNASTTLTARSLGGLGTFDGALASSGALPVWTPDGVTFGANTQFIQYSPTFNVDFTKGGFSVYAVWSAMGVPIIFGEGNFQLFGAFPSIEINNVITTLVGGGSTWQAQSRNYNGNRYFNGVDQPTSGNAAYGWNADTLTLQRNGGDVLTQNSPSFTATNGAYGLRTTGRNNSTTAATSRVSHLIAFAPSIGMTSSRMAQLHALYRQTLGLGLGLP
jgi:hypothetical protein